MTTETASVICANTNKPKIVKVGDWVGFKCDIEQYGRIKEIKKLYSPCRGGQTVILILENPNGFEGEYIENETEYHAMAEDCWGD